MLKQQIRLTILMLAIIVLSLGCASDPLKSDMKSLDLEKNSIVLFRLDTANEFKPKYKLIAGTLDIININKGSENQSILSKSVSSENASNNSYLVNIKLEKGTYILTDIRGVAPTSPINIHATNGSFRFPLYKKIFVGEAEIIYLGRVSIKNTERTSEQQIRSGAPIPVIIQRLTGLYNGTFTSSISDNYKEDIELFINKFPILAEKNIKKSIFSTRDADNKIIEDEVQKFHDDSLNQKLGY